MLPSGMVTILVRWGLDVCGTALNITLTVMAGYPLSRKKLRFRGLLTFIFVFTLLFNGGLIPTYMLVQKLGIINTRWAMILPSAIHAFNVILNIAGSPELYPLPHAACSCDERPLPVLLQMTCRILA